MGPPSWPCNTRRTVSSEAPLHRIRNGTLLACATGMPEHSGTSRASASRVPEGRTSPAQLRLEVVWLPMARTCEFPISPVHQAPGATGRTDTASEGQSGHMRQAVTSPPATGRMRGIMPSPGVHAVQVVVRHGRRPCPPPAIPPGECRLLQLSNPRRKEGDKEADHRGHNLHTRWTRRHSALRLSVAPVRVVDCARYAFMVRCCPCVTLPCASCPGCHRSVRRTPRTAVSRRASTDRSMDHCAHNHARLVPASCVVVAQVRSGVVLSPCHRTLQFPMCLVHQAPRITTRTETPKEAQKDLSISLARRVCRRFQHNHEESIVVQAVRLWFLRVWARSRALRKAWHDHCKASSGHPAPTHRRLP